MIDLYNTCGGNADQYTNKDAIWKLAARWNQQSRILNGHETVTIVRKSKKKNHKRSIL